MKLSVNKGAIKSQAMAIVKQLNSENHVSRVNGKWELYCYPSYGEICISSYKHREYSDAISVKKEETFDTLLRIITHWAKTK